MNNSKWAGLVGTIDLTKRSFSLLVIDPKNEFIEMVSSYHLDRGEPDYLYCSDNNAVVVVPNVDLFTEYGSFATFRDYLKPTLLVDELSRFGMPETAFNFPVSASTFDLFFTMALRESLVLLSDYRGLKF